MIDDISMVISAETTGHIQDCRCGLPSSIDREKVVFGFDGVVDRIRRVIETRSGPEEFETMNSMTQFSSRIEESSDLNTSCSIEWQDCGRRAGGHTSHLGRAMEQLGCKPTLIGTFGDPPLETFTREYERAELLSLGKAATTDAVEFHDGKVLLSNTGSLATLDWEAICDAVERNTLASRIDRTRVFGIGYWATILQLPSILEGINDELWPRLRDPPERILFDPADIRRLSETTIEDGIEAINRLDDTVPVTVSSNRTETLRIASLFKDISGDSLAEAARVAREGLGVSKFAVHTPTEAISVTEMNEDQIEIPYEPEPELTTSAGDHFNAGLILGRLAGLDDGAQLVTGAGVAGYFIRNANPPTYEQLCGFIDEYEEHFAESQAAD